MDDGRQLISVKQERRKTFFKPFSGLLAQISSCCAERRVGSHDRKEPNRGRSSNLPPRDKWRGPSSVQHVGKKPLQKRISAQAAYRIGVALESAYSILRRQSEPPMTRFVALQLSQSHTYSIEKARQDFDFQPPVDYETAYQRLMDGLKSVKIKNA